MSKSNIYQPKKVEKKLEEKSKTEKQFEVSKKQVNIKKAPLIIDMSDKPDLESGFEKY